MSAALCSANLGRHEVHWQQRRSHQRLLCCRTRSQVRSGVILSVSSDCFDAHLFVRGLVCAFQIPSAAGVAVENTENAASALNSSARAGGHTSSVTASAMQRSLRFAPATYAGGVSSPRSPLLKVFDLSLNSMDVLSSLLNRSPDREHNTVGSGLLHRGSWFRSISGSSVSQRNADGDCRIVTISTPPSRRHCRCYGICQCPGIHAACGSSIRSRSGRQVRR